MIPASASASAALALLTPFTPLASWTLVPKLIACYLNGEPVLAPATVRTVEQLLQKLEATGASVESKALREQLAAKLAAAQPRKSR